MLDRRLAVPFPPLLLVACAALLPAQEDRRPQPLPAGADAFTQARYHQEKSRFWSERLFEECTRDGAAKEEWRSDLQELLATYAGPWCVFLAVGDAGPRLTKLTKRLGDAGCDLPIVRLITADALFYANDVEGARTKYRDAASAMQTASPLARFQLHHRLAMFHDYEKQPERTREAAAAREACLVELAASPVFAGGNERFFLDMALFCWNGRVAPGDLPALERKEKAAGEPTYPLLVLRAMYHNTMAWAARGQGAASSIAAGERRTFAQELEAAATACAQAHAMCPRHPEAPTEMIKTLGPGGGGPKELRAWFDRAVAAQFDWQEAYTSLMHYLQPRWGGSQRALFALGKECLATGRFDTAVPGLYRTAVHYVTLGTNDAKAVWADAEVQDALAELDRGALAAATSDAAKRTVRTHRIVALAIGGRAEAAATLREEWKGALDATVLTVYGVDEPWLAKTLRPHLKNFVPPTIVSQDLFLGFATAPMRGEDEARPLTAHERATTELQTKSNFREWLNRTFAAAWEKNGVRDERWDAAAKALVARTGDLFVSDPTPDDAALATKLLDAKCKDPLALYAASRALPDGDLNRMGRAIRATLPALAKSQPPFFSFWITWQGSDLATRAGQPGVGSGLLPDMRKHLLAAAADPMFTGDARRHFVRCAYQADELARPGNDWLDERTLAGVTANEGIDPWLRNVLVGLRHASLAKNVAGSASERDAVLRVATQFLEKAHEIEPRFPEAAVGMIYVSTLAAGGRSPREWFDRAADAQLDYSPAYAAFVDSLRPRNGGSIHAMYRFAVECLDSGRFDTDVPLWYARTLQRIQEEVPRRRDVWAAKGVAEGLQRMFDGYEKQQRKDLAPSILASGRCVLAWAAGRYPEALAAWKAADRKLDPRWLTMIGLDDATLVEADLRWLESQPRTK